MSKSTKSRKNFRINEIKCDYECVNSGLPDGDAWHSFAEDWHHNKVALHLHIIAKRPISELEAGEYCAYLQSPRSQGLDINNGVGVVGSKCRSFPETMDQGNGTVLVPIIDFSKDYERPSIGKLLCWSWLELLKKGKCRWDDPLLEFTQCRAVLLSSLVNRKLNELLFIGGTSNSTGKRDVIEGGMQTVRGIPNGEGEIGRGWLDSGNAEAMPPVTIIAFKHGVRVSLNESIGDSLGLQKVELCAPKLRYCRQKIKLERAHLGLKGL